MNQFQSKPELPNSTAVLILGIISLVFGLMSCVFGPVFIIALVLAIVALAMSGSGLRTHRQNPGAYSGHGNIQAGRICAIITLCIGGLFILLVLGYLIFVGTLITSSPFF